MVCIRDARSSNVTLAFYNRPRGLHDLLVHFLGKGISVMYKLSSTKIPEYLNSKLHVDTRSSKAGKALNDPN